jgi:membrane protease YdiL (CAAX protease family)
MVLSVMFHWDLALIVAFLGTAVPWMGRRRVQQLLRIPHTSKTERLTLYASTMAFQWLIAAIILWRVAADRIATQRLGAQVTHALLTGAVAAGLSVLIFANQVYSVRRIGATQLDERNILIQLALKVFPQDATERLAFFAVVVTVAFCEEWIYRGFVQLMFQSWARSAVAGIVGSAVLFAGAHAYQGRRGLFSTFSVGLIFSAVRFWTGSLIPSIAAHFVADLTAGYLASHFVRAAMQHQSVTRGTNERTS